MAGLNEPSWVTQWNGADSTRDDGVIGAIAAKQFDDTLPLPYRVLTFTEPLRSIDVLTYDEAGVLLNLFIPQGAMSAKGRPRWTPK